MKTIRRLVVSLDGTWNNRSDSTNVLYNHALAHACNEKLLHGNNVTQMLYYQEGVGTGPLDRITGGGFAVGLEDHVRGAYDWLVQTFLEGDGTSDNPPDEIYIFGFSRGAYIARSLVGFISTCGLLRRGAPLTVNQLWANYCILGREHEERGGGIMGRIFGNPCSTFQRITKLVKDPWLVDKLSPVPEGQVPGQRQDIALNPTEELLVRWSRRVKVTYLGVYDTVGAVGWDALAIPGLRSKLAVQHNMRPTTIIQKCRHALAIDEHRSSFAHTPFLAYIGTKTSASELQHLGIVAPVAVRGQAVVMDEESRKRIADFWKDRIEQRWFVGAHSNIGGGYPDNLLAQRPLEWILQGACDAGLICEKLLPISKVTPTQAHPCDSFAKFAASLWMTVIRAKRNYRVIDPEPVFRANRDEAKNRNAVNTGFALESINETVDESVIEYWESSQTVPPNLAHYASHLETVSPQRANDVRALTHKESGNVWPGHGYWAQFVIVLWATLAAVGVVAADRFFCIWPNSAPVWVLCMVAGIFPLVDCVESGVNVVRARQGNTAWREAFLDAVFWMRSIGVLLFVIGLISAFFVLLTSGWHTTSYSHAWVMAHGYMVKYGTVAACAAGGVLIANLLNQSLCSRPGVKLLAMISCPTIVILSFLFALPVLHGVGYAVTSTLGGTQTAVLITSCPSKMRTAGLLLLLQLAFACFWSAFTWVREPMGRANLGSILKLQMRLTPDGVKACLDRWCVMLGHHSGVGTTSCAMTHVVKQAIVRDWYGFIPVYSVMIGFGLWFGLPELGWKNHFVFFQYFWLVLPLVTWVTDFLENTSHYYCYLPLHETGGKPSSWLTALTFAMTAVKTVTFTVGLLTVVLVLLLLSKSIAFHPALYGWRGLIALAISTGTVLFVVLLTLWVLIYRFRR